MRIMLLFLSESFYRHIFVTDDRFGFRKNKLRILIYVSTFKKSDIKCGMLSNVELFNDRLNKNR